MIVEVRARMWQMSKPVRVVPGVRYFLLEPGMGFWPDPSRLSLVELQRRDRRWS